MVQKRSNEFMTSTPISSQRHVRVTSGVRRVLRWCGIALLVPILCVEVDWSAAAQSPSARAGASPEPITPIPAGTGLDPLRRALGERLFQDRRLSRADTHSCLSCHDVETNGASAREHDTAEGQPKTLNTPTVFNVSLNFRLNWEGNLRSLEEGVERSLRSSMASSTEEAVGKLRGDPEAVRQFRDAYGREPDAAALMDAIATYERSLVTPGSRFDRWLAGEADAITPLELSGYQTFKSLGCISCHQGVNVGGNLFQRHGIFHPLGSPEPALLRVPSLRNVAATAPYFHDGSAGTLPEAVRMMGLAQLDRVLTESQITAIVAFLNTLTGTYRGHLVRSGVATPQPSPAFR
jgi:cytochrome c peroxidase